MMFKMLPFLPVMRKWRRISVQDYAKRFKNPFLREAFHVTFGGELPDFPVLAMLMSLSWMHLKQAGYPLGGSLEFARAIEQRYHGLGGEIQYKAPVAKILVENNKGVGVRLANGAEIRGDIIISAADGHTTIFAMLDGRYINPKIQGFYDRPSLFPPLICIGLGVARSFDDVTPSVAGMSYPLTEPVTIAGKEFKRLGVQIHNFDPSLAPSGKTVLRVMFDSNYDYWKDLSRDSERYKAEKKDIADKVIALLDQRFPGLAEQVEMCDVATPMTWVRYTGNWKGSYEGWLITRQTFLMRMSKTLPGLKDFYMAGQWVEPGGGVPMAAMSGRNVIQIICKRDKRPFVTKIP
jgi:phytoene dehydrogenase-like protein